MCQHYQHFTIRFSIRSENSQAAKATKISIDFSKYSTFADSGPVVEELDKLDIYLSLSPPPSSKTVLEVWKDYKETLSKLHMLALKVFCVQASSAPADRLFSDAGNIFTEKRTLLGWGKLDDLLFLKGNV